MGIGKLRISRKALSPVIGTFLAVYVIATAVLYAMAIQELLSRVWARRGNNNNRKEMEVLLGLDSDFRL